MIITGLGISVLCALVVIPYILDPDRSNAATVDTTAARRKRCHEPVADLDLENVQDGRGPT